ncbi:hypothetical protein BaRGS_00000360, partial [Batillaria attramentaria]
EAFYIRHSIWFLYLLVVLAINMSLVMALQLSSQHVNLLQDRTTLDNLQGAPDQVGYVSHFQCHFAGQNQSSVQS